MFYHHDDPGFIKIIDDFILASTDDDDDNGSFSCIIKNIDSEATKSGISFYHMIFILIQKDSIANRKKKWLKKDM